MVAAEGQVEQQALREALEGAAVLIRPAAAEGAHGGGNSRLVEQLAVQIEAYPLPVPVHAPHVEGVAPGRRLRLEAGERIMAAVPLGHIATLRAPRHIGQDGGLALDVVELHHVDLAALGPSGHHAHRPDGGPATHRRGNLGAHLKASVGPRRGRLREGVAPGDDAGRGVGIAGIVLAGLDDEAAVFAPGVLLAVELGLVIAHVAVLVGPEIGIGAPVSVEFIVEDEAVAGILLRSAPLPLREGKAATH